MDKHFYYCIAKDKEAFICCIIPNKTTRLDVKLQYISQDECEIMVTDLGFGEMFPSSGKVWKETTRW